MTAPLPSPPFVCVVAAWAVCLIATALPAGEFDYEHEAIGYSQATPTDPVARLRVKLDAGEVALEDEPEFGRLRALLRELDVPESSQALVFSKTSLQRDKIAPRTPRAVYFNDDVYVGYCQGGKVIEVAAADPQLGAVFYTLDQTDRERPTLTRQGDNCLICHASSAHTGGVPGFVLRSVYTDAGGLPVLSQGSFRIDQTSPFEQRWGGWYVTGTHGGQKHLGNHVVRDKAKATEIDPMNRNVTDLAGRFDASKYLTPHSDLVALMVLEHQAAAHNRIAQANHLTRRALWDERALDEAFGDPADRFRESTVRRIDHAVEPLVKYLLFSEEAKLTEPVAGTTAFAAEFAARGPRDKRGRSLRDLDLSTRLFKYPCSYLIYSDAFAGLPEPAKERTLRRLWEVLTGRDTAPEFAHLSPADRKAILEILLDTLPDLPRYWRE